MLIAFGYRHAEIYLIRSITGVQLYASFLENSLTFTDLLKTIQMQCDELRQLRLHLLQQTSIGGRAQLPTLPYPESTFLVKLQRQEYERRRRT